MTRWMKFAGALALPLVFVGGVAAIAAADGGHCNHGGPGMRGRHAGFGDLRLLDLSDDQRAAVRDLVTRQHESMKPLFDQMKQLHQQQETALASGKVDAAQVGNLTIQQSKLRDQMKAEHQKLQDSIGALLTPDQKELWSKAQAARQKAHGSFQQRQQRAPAADSAN